MNKYGAIQLGRIRKALGAYGVSKGSLSDATFSEYRALMGWKGQEGGQGGTERFAIEFPVFPVVPTDGGDAHARKEAVAALKRALDCVDNL